MEIFRYEDVTLPYEGIPLRLFARDHNSGAPGCEFHWHEELEFYYVVNGGVLLSCGGEQEWLYPGDIGFVNSCIPHRGLDFLDGTRHYILQMNLELLQGETDMRENRTYSSLVMERLHGIPAFLHSQKELCRLFAEMTQEWEQQELGAELAIKARMFQILVWLLRMAPQPERLGSTGPYEEDSLRHVREALRYLAARYAFPEETSLPKIASEMGISVPYLCRIFRRHTGRTITGYLNELRCARAASLIRSGTPLMEAGRQVGVEDYNYFSRMFKKTTGRLPSEFRPGK